MYLFFLTFNKGNIMTVARMESKIHETNSIRDLLKFVNHNTWIFFDLDNTVMESAMELGSDQWFGTLIGHACKIIPDQEEASSLVIAIYQSVQHHVRTKAVEEEIVQLIKSLQDIGMPIFALTARDKTLINTTQRQLSEVGIDFGRYQHDHDDKMYLEFNTKNLAVFYRGIIYCNGNDKGKCLETFLAKCEKPQHLIMIDDKKKHVEHVQKTVENLGIPFVGIRYGRLDEKIKKFDFNTSHQQLAEIKAKLPEPIQNALQRLNIPHHSASEFKNNALFAPDPHKPISRKRKNAGELEDSRPQSALSFFHKRRRLEWELKKDDHKIEHRY